MCGLSLHSPTAYRANLANSLQTKCTWCLKIRCCLDPSFAQLMREALLPDSSPPWPRKLQTFATLQSADSVICSQSLAEDAARRVAVVTGVV